MGDGLGGGICWRGLWGCSAFRVRSQRGGSVSAGGRWSVYYQTISSSLGVRKFSIKLSIVDTTGGLVEFSKGMFCFIRGDWVWGGNFF